MSENEWVFLERARQLGLARELIRADDLYCSATALVAVHTAIALNDALLLHLGARRPKGRDHSSAVTETEHACSAKKIDAKGLKHLKTLLSRKTAVSYGEVSVSFEVASALAASSERFEEWVFSIIRFNERS